MNELIKQVEQWSADKGLNKSDPTKQFLKVSEEFGEIAAALARNDMDEFKDEVGDTIVTLIILAQQQKIIEEIDEIAATIERNDIDEFKDAVGDTIVTLIILAQQQGTNVEECLELAYNVIKGRTGKMIDGVFVKSEDLEGK